MATELIEEASVIVVDDEESIREGCRQALETEGYRTAVARDGEHGLRLVEQLNPRAVVIDLKMPGMSGMEMLEKINQTTPEVVSIIITGYASLDSAIEAMKLGADDYLCKPFDDEALLEAIKRGLTKRLVGKKPPPLVSPVAIEFKPVRRFARVIKTLNAGEFANFVDKMIAELTVVGVKAKEGEQERFVFGSLANAAELRLDYDVSILPPKKYLLPPRETLVRFKLGDSPEATPCIEEPPPTVLIGIHPYDMIAINQLDRLMSEVNPDPNYLARRAALTLIGVTPARVAKKAFWSTMNCGKVAEGFDLWLSDIGGAWAVEAATDKGVALLDKYAAARNATAQQLEAQAKVLEKAQNMAAPAEINFRPAELPALLRRSFDHSVWEEKARTCLSCGSCNLVCPTCYCFDVKDDVNLSMTQGERYRIWDGCVLEDFAKVGTGENFREERLQRYRHRFFRKGMYLYDKYGHIACVGCGRCATVCLPDIANPVTVYKILKETQ